MLQVMLNWQEFRLYRQPYENSDIFT